MGASQVSVANQHSVLSEWMARQYRFSAAAMLRAVSATDLLKDRCEGHSSALHAFAQDIEGSTTSWPAKQAQSTKTVAFFPFIGSAGDDAKPFEQLRSRGAKQTMKTLKSPALGGTILMWTSLYGLGMSQAQNHGGCYVTLSPTDATRGIRYWRPRPHASTGTNVSKNCGQPKRTLGKCPGCMSSCGRSTFSRVASRFRMRPSRKSICRR